jgi:hypothetical protein
MRLPVPKIKSLRYEGALRYTVDLDVEFRARLRRVLRQAAFSTEKDTIEFIVEEHATRFVLEEYLKRPWKDCAVDVQCRRCLGAGCEVAAIVVDQFDEKDRVDALARLKISDPLDRPS